MDEINPVQDTREPKNNKVLFFVITIVLLLIVAGGYVWWKSNGGKNSGKNEQEFIEDQKTNQSVLSIFGQIENIENNKIAVMESSTGLSSTFVWPEGASVTKENFADEGFSKISFADLKKGQTVSLMYQNNQTKTPLSIVLMGGTNISGEVIGVENNEVNIRNQQDTYLVKIAKQTNIIRLGSNGKMEKNLPITEIKNGDYLAITAENTMKDGENTVTADKVEILSQEK